MSIQAKFNLLGMLLLPSCAVIAGLILFGPRGDTALALFGLNLIPMLIAGALSGLLLLLTRRAPAATRWIALWPTLLPAVFGSLWYLWRALSPAAVAPGAEHIAGPQYLLLAVIALAILALPGCLIGRRQRATV